MWKTARPRGLPAAGAAWQPDLLAVLTAELEVKAQVAEIGRILFTNYAFAFEVTSVLILVATLCYATASIIVDRGLADLDPMGPIAASLGLVTLVLAPIISRLLSMAVSRKREYLADATSAQFTRNPMALASALEKLAGATGATRSITRGAAHLCIVDPAPGLLSSREGFLADVLTSHPPIRQRIIRLEGMGYQQAKRESEARKHQKDDGAQHDLDAPRRSWSQGRPRNSPQNRNEARSRTCGRPRKPSPRTTTRTATSRCTRSR